LDEANRPYNEAMNMKKLFSSLPGENPELFFDTSGRPDSIKGGDGLGGLTLDYPNYGSTTISKFNILTCGVFKVTVTDEFEYTECQFDYKYRAKFLIEGLEIWVEVASDIPSVKRIEKAFELLPPKVQDQIIEGIKKNSESLEQMAKDRFHSKLEYAKSHDALMRVRNDIVALHSKGHFDQTKRKGLFFP